jgi:cytochrome c553
MDIGMRHLHVAVVTLLLLFILFKTILLVANKTELLDKVRAKTKVVDMILGSLVLVTGAYLASLKPSIESYLLIKIVLILIAIPLAIIGLKKHKKLLAVLSLLIIIYVFGVGETQSYKFKRDPITISNISDPGKEIYQKLCVECHGNDGKLGLYKAPDLGSSQMELAEKKARILQGKGIMRGYKNELSDEQVNILLEYIDTLP